jgi:histidine triad (HIT) family protein
MFDFAPIGAAVALLGTAFVTTIGWRLIPKERKAFLHELSDESAAAIGRVLPRLSRAVLQATGATAYNILQNNGAAAHQAVMHVHFHIIPKTEDGGLGVGWPAGSLDEATAQKLMGRIQSALESEA